jgi:adenine-specific DNA methylase
VDDLDLFLAGTPGDEPPRVRAATFPPRYRIHKYWGKKPGNVVAAYIERFSEPGAPVLDLFAGSGVVLAESLLAGRRGVAVDLNPIAGLITRVTVEGADLAGFAAEASRIQDAGRGLRRELFGERCDRCGAIGDVVSTAFEEERALRITLDCASCGTVVQAPRAGDARLDPTGRGLPEIGAHPDEALFLGWEMRKLKRRGLKRWSELFTRRNLVAVAFLRREIDRAGDAKIRRALLVSFSAHLAQSTRMIGDPTSRGGGPSWKLNCYWLPRTWLELNPFRYFENRIKRTADGLADMARRLPRPMRDGEDYRIVTGSSERLGEVVPAGSIGYVFTDPPYGGEGIQYGELSMLWNLWCGEAITLEREVAFNPVQGKNEADYQRRLTECMAAAHTALAPGGFTTVTFANKDRGVWRALLQACKTAGFELRHAVPMTPSAPNLTNILSDAAPKADVILSFRKPAARSSRPSR